MSRVSLRLATHEDVPALVTMGAAFYALARYGKQIPFCPTSAASYAAHVIDNGFVLLAESEGRAVGMLGCYVAPFPMNLAHRTCTEVMWYVDPDTRHGGAAIQLLRRSVFEAKIRGAKWLAMSVLDTSPPQAAALYQRLGFRLAESSYLLEL